MPDTGNGTWFDSPSTATPITAAKLNNLEAGLKASATRRYLDLVEDYGVNSGMTATARTTAIQQAITDALAADKPLYIPTGYYQINGALNAQGDYLKIFGDGQGASRIAQTTANTPILKVGGMFQKFEGLALEYVTQQVSTATNANCVEFYHSYFSHFSDIYTYAGARHWYIPQVESPTGSGINSGAFSNVFENIRGLGATINYINMSGFVAFWTGNVWNNVYFNNKVGGSILGITGPVVLFGNGDENVINQLNIEDVDLSIAGSPDRLMQLTNRATVINGLHFERCKLASAASVLVHCGSLSKTRVNMMTVAWSEVTNTASGNRSLFRLFQARLEVSGLNLHNLLKEATTSTYIVDVNDNTNRAKAVVTMADYDATATSTSAMGTTGVTWATGAFFTANAVNDGTSIVNVT